MFPSTAQQAFSAQSGLFNDEDDDDNNNGSGSKTTQDADTSDLNHEVYLCMVWHGGFLGLAFYDLGSLQIHFMLDIQENDNFAIVRQVVHQIHPSVIVLNTIQDSRILSFLRSIVSDIRVGHSGFSNDSCRIEFLPNVDFNFQVCKRRILALNLPSVSKHLSQDEKSLYFSSLLPFGNSNMISSVGGLLKYLEKTRVGIELEADVAQVPVLGFRAFIPEWFLRPLKNAAPVKQRHEAVEYFMSAHNMEVVKCLSGCLKHIKYIPKILLRMSKAQATVGDWSALYKTLYHAVYIGDIAKAQPSCIDIFRKIANAFTEDLHKCVNLISKTIDFEESKIRKRFMVLPHVDKKLDEKKRMFNGLPDFMSKVASEEIEKLRSDIKECVVSFLPEIGYLLVIELPEGKTTEDYRNIEGIRFMFESNNQLFYKSPKTEELDSILGDTQGEIIDLEVNIMHRLQTTILECTSVMMSIMELAAELDCLMALATCACEFGFIKPTLVQENIIHIKGSRHPLQELCCNIFVPNDVMLGGSSSKMKLITGPNACGKSVYLKQVALIVFMTYVGSFVPAEETRIGPCDAIFSRLKSVESTAVHMSTFMQDLSQVSQALRSASSKSLVIMDEFGKGTESTDGLSLLTAVIKYWIKRQSECPFTLMATHFHSIIQQRLLPVTSHIEYLTFDTVANEEELIFLYQLIPGHTSSSYACKCAAQVGIPNQVVKRGQQVSDLLCQFKIVPVEDSSTLQAKRRMHERIVDKFLDLNLNEDNMNEFLKGFVLKLCDDAVGAGEDRQPIKNDDHVKKGFSSTKTSAHLDKPSTSEDVLVVLEKDQTKSNQDKQRIRGTQTALRKNDYCYGVKIVNTETQRPALQNGSEIMNIGKSDPTFDTPVFPTDSMTETDYAQEQFPPSQKETGATETHLFRSGNIKDGKKMPTGKKENRNIKLSQIENNYTKNSQSRQVQKVSVRSTKCQRLPLFATPCSPKLYNQEEYCKPQASSTFTMKRKRDNIGPTITHVKHEKLINAPTPCFNYIERNPPCTKGTHRSSSTRDDSSIDDPEETDRQRRIGTSTDPSYTGRSSDVSELVVKTALSIPFNPRQDTTSTDGDEHRPINIFNGKEKNRMFTPRDSLDVPQSFSLSSLTDDEMQDKVTTDTDDPGHDAFFRQTSSHPFSLGNLKSKTPSSTTGSARKAGTSSIVSQKGPSTRVIRKLKEESTDLPSSVETTPIAPGKANSYHAVNRVSSLEYELSS